jgi:hypothetical protein
VEEWLMTTPAGAVAADAERQAPPKKTGDNIFSRKYGPLPGWGWSLLAGGGALAFFWWRSRKKAEAATTALSSSATAGWEGAASALQREIDQLQGGATAGGSPPIVTPYSTGPTTSKSTGTGPTTSKTTGTTTSKTPGPIRGLQVVLRSPTVVTVEWKPPSSGGNVTYNFQITPKDSGPHNIGARTSYNVGGLKADTHYTAHVGASGGPTSTKAFTTPKKK